MNAALQVLALDTTTELMAVAVQGSAGTIRIESDRGLRHGAELALTIDAALASALVAPDELELIVVGIGPGSFTGVRIGLATAKGLAAPRSVPITGVSGLDAIAWRYRGYPGLVVPAIDGRKLRVYSALYRAGTRSGDYLDISPSELVEAAEANPSDSSDGHAPLLCGPAAGLVRSRTGEAAALWYTDDSASGTAVPIGELLELGIERGGQPAAAVQPLYLRKSEAELGIRS